MSTQPTTTPPGGGSWLWDAKKSEWVPKPPEAPAAPATETQQPPAQE